MSLGEQVEHGLTDSGANAEDALELVRSRPIDGQPAKVAGDHLHEGVRALHDVPTPFRSS
jgi:hypothetical protein